MAGADYFALAPLKRGFRAELAGVTQPGDWREFARVTLALDGEAEWLAYADAAGGQNRFVAFREGALVGAFFAAREPVGVARSWIGESLGQIFAPAERLRLLAGRPGAQSRDKGAIVCASFDVGRNEILEVAARPGGASVEAIGLTLKAGTNCGSCRAEIQRLTTTAGMKAERSIGAKGRM